jgi:hypothetical protein
MSRAKFRVGEYPVRRKHTYMPCALGPRHDEADDAEKARLLNATYWADYITEAEWRALLDEPGCSPSAKSRLKKKAAGWNIALGRIAVLNPRLFREITEQSERLYEEQTGVEHPVPVRFLKEDEQHAS